jgi:hypothetical protein
VQPSARRALLRVVVGVAALAAFVALALLVARAFRSDEERISEAVDDARDALVDRDREAFLAWFAPEVRYLAKGDRKALESDLDRWIAGRIGRVTLLERQIEVAGDAAKIRLRCDVGHLFQSFRVVDVTLDAVRTDDGWKVTSLDWR